MKIKVNRAPVQTLWAAVVAQQLGYSRTEALTLGKALAGLNAQSKGRRLGLYAPRPEDESKAAQETIAVPDSVELMGRRIPVVRTQAGLRAADKGKAMQPDAVQRYLESKFGEHLAEVEQAMTKLARSYPPAQLAIQGYPLYERFRPQIPKGERGWGAAGDLDLALLRRLLRPRVRK